LRLSFASAQTKLLRGDITQGFALKSYPMPRRALIVAVIVGFFSVVSTAQDQHACDYVIKKVWFESASGLTSEQVQKLHNLVEGRCYDPAKPSSVSKAIYDELRQWGYRQVEVYDPDKFHVQNDSVHPTPITFVVDFRVNDLTTCPAIQPKDAGYEDAMAIHGILERNGVEVWCVGRSKMAHVFEGQIDAALFVTAKGRFEALFFPQEQKLQRLVITSEYHEGWYAYTFSGAPKWLPENQTVTTKRPWYIVRSGDWLFMTGKMQLAAHLESIFGPAASELGAATHP
jgi:hypothetical protein